MGRPDIQPEAQIRGPKHPKSNVLSKPPTILNPRRHIQAPGTYGRSPRFPHPLRPKSWHLVGNIRFIIPPLRRSLRPPSGKLLHTQQSRRPHSRSRHLRQRHLPSSPIPNYLPTKLLLFSKPYAGIGTFSSISLHFSNHNLISNSSHSLNPTSHASASPPNKSASGSTTAKASSSASASDSTSSSRSPSSAS